MDKKTAFVIVSDIQVGRFGLLDQQRNFAHRHTFVKNFSDKIKSNYKPDDYDFVIVASGDLASEGKVNEYKFVIEFLLILAIELDVKRKNIHLCPGNHDFELTKVDTALEKFNNYRNFQNNFFTNTKFLDGFDDLVKHLKNINIYERAVELFEELCLDRKVNDFTQPDDISYYSKNDELKLEVLSYNSAFASDIKENNFGLFPFEKIFSTYSDVLRENKNLSYLRIIIGHHNFESVNKHDSSSTRNSRELKTFLFDNEFHLCIHGHQHYPEVKKWFRNEQEIVVVGSGSVSADKKEILSGDNQITIIEYSNPFFSYAGLELKLGNNWEFVPSKEIYPLLGRRTPVIISREAVGNANRVLISYARKSIMQTFINANKPSTDLIEKILGQKGFPEDIEIKRILSAESESQVEFLKSNFKLSRKHKSLELFCFDNSLFPQYPFLNVLITDKQNVLLNFSDSDKSSTNAIFINDKQFAKIMSAFIRPYAEVPLTQELVRQKENSFKSNGIMNIAKMIEEKLRESYHSKVLFFKRLGSSVNRRKNLSGIRFYDIDFLIIDEQIDRTKYHQILKEAKNLAIEKSNDARKIYIEHRLGPIRPEPPIGQGRIRIQIHIHVFSYKDLNELPEWLKLEILNDVIPKDDQFPKIVKLKKNLINCIKSHDVWGIDRLLYYCEHDIIPYHLWGENSRKVFQKTLHEETLQKRWEYLEFYCYIVRVTMLNFLLLKNSKDNSFFDLIDVDLIESFLDDYPEMDQFKRFFEELFNEKMNYRKKGFTNITRLILRQYAEKIKTILSILKEGLT